MPKLRKDGFEKNVFINCPFDSKYESLLRPLLFTVLYLGHNPKISSERSDSGEQRLEKICSFIRSSKYSIHDLSRLKSSQKNEYSRHNMPFELGIDYGSRKFTRTHLGKKRFLILEKERYRYVKALSDLSGVDIKRHRDEPKDLISAVRNWYLDTVGLKKADPPSQIYFAFMDFMADFDRDRRKEGYRAADIYSMPTSEFIGFIRAWLRKKGIR